MRGELHLILSELIELSTIAEDGGKDTSISISTEIASQRADRAERMVIACCDLLDNVALFLIGSETSEEMVNMNSGIWETLPFQSLLDLQKVREFRCFCFVVHPTLIFRIQYISLGYCWYFSRHKRIF